MFGKLGVLEIAIIVLIIVIIFGAGRIAQVGGELGKGIKAFKDGLQGKNEPESNDESEVVDSDKVE